MTSKPQAAMILLAFALCSGCATEAVKLGPRAESGGYQIYRRGAEDAEKKL